MSKWTQYSEIGQFISENEDSMLEHESENNLLLGLADSIAKSKRPFDHPLFLACKNEQGNVIAQALRTNLERPLAITRLTEQNVELLCEYLLLNKVILSGVVGPKSASIRFNQLWCEMNSIQSSIGMEQGIYELTKIIPPRQITGSLHRVCESDRAIVLPMIEGFVIDCFPEDLNPQKTAMHSWELQIKNHSLYVLKNFEDQIVSMACSSRESKNAACISLVYTPPHLRGKGYASQTVAALSQKILDSGKSKCNLFTDLKNPTSNSIYQKIGYQWVSESRHFNFKL